MKIIYSYNKRGFEADMFRETIAGASDDRHTFIPFNHDPYIHTRDYLRAQLLDNQYYQRHPGLMRLYADIEAMIHDLRADVLLVDNALPYHPDFLRTLNVFKVMRTTDGPVCAYDRDFAYVHAYDQVLFHSPAYSRDMGMEEKLRYVGAKDARFWPLGLFDRMFDHSETEETILSHERDIDLDVLVDLGGVDLDMDLARVDRVGLQVAGNAVVEPHPERQEQVGFLDGMVDPRLAVHPHHAHVERVRCGNGANPEQRRGERDIALLRERLHRLHGARNQDSMSG